MGQAALAVDAGVGPEADQHDLAVQRLEVDGLPSGGVEPLGDAVDGGRRSAGAQFVDAVLATGELLVLVVVETGELLPRGVVVLDLLLRDGGVVGQRALDRVGDVEREGQREGDHQRTGGDARLARTGTERADALGGQDGSGARHVQQPEAQAEHEGAAFLVDLALGDTGEGLLQQPLDGREDQPQADEDQQREPDVTQDVLRQPQGRDQGDAEQGEEAEAEDETGDDGVGAPVTRSFGGASGDAASSVSPPCSASRAPSCRTAAGCTAGARTAEARTAGSRRLGGAPPGGACSPGPPARKTTGSTGRMQGETAVMRPPRSPIRINVSMSVLLWSRERPTRSARSLLIRRRTEPGLVLSPLGFRICEAPGSISLAHVTLA